MVMKLLTCFSQKRDQLIEIENDKMTMKSSLNIIWVVNMAE